MERRIAGTNGARPGAPVCRPGTPQNNVGMLGRGSTLYQSPSQRKSSQNVRQINGLEILQNQGDRISRLELKIEQLEQMNVMNMSKTEAQLKKKDKTIDLMNGEFRTTMKELRTHIIELQTKIKHLNGDIPIVKAVKKEIQSVMVTNPPLPPGILEKLEEYKQENIRLEITET